MRRVVRARSYFLVVDPFEVDITIRKTERLALQVGKSYAELAMLATGMINIGAEGLSLQDRPSHLATAAGRSLPTNPGKGS